MKIRIFVYKIWRFNYFEYEIQKDGKDDFLFFYIDIYIYIYVSNSSNSISFLSLTAIDVSKYPFTFPSFVE